MAKGKRHEEPQEISGQEVTKYMFIAIGAIIAVGLLMAGGLNLYFMIAKTESTGPQPPVETVEVAPIVEEPVVEEPVVEPTVNETEAENTAVNQTAEQDITQNQQTNQTTTNETVTLEVTNTAQNTTNTSSVVSYTFDQMSITFPSTLNHIQPGKASYHYINITKPDGKPALNSEGFEVKVTLKSSQGSPNQIIPQYEKGAWLISFYMVPTGVNTLTVTAGCKDGVNYCSRIFSGTPKTEQTQFTVS